MTLYKLTYAFDSSGGNIEYQTTQRVQKEAATSDTEVTLVTTGLSLESERIEGTAIVELSDDIAPADVFASATAVDQVSPADIAETAITDTDSEPAADPQPNTDIPRFEASDEMAHLLGGVNETPGRGALLYSNLTRCHPHERDLWLVSIQTTDVAVPGGLTKRDIVEFYRENLDLLDDEPALKIGVFHRVAEPTIQLSVVASVTDREEAQKLAKRVSSAGAMNVYRFELSKESLVVGTATHGPGQIEAIFRSPSGDTVCSRELAYRVWYAGLNVNFHPLGVIIDRDLYRPILSERTAPGVSEVGTALDVETYRGSKTSRPWQFGITRQNGQILLTQARAAPPKFDPVIKRFPVETRTLGDEPLVFSHTVSRRVWSENPVNTQVQSQRSEGLRTQFLYADGDGWHLIQPKALEDQSETADSSFEQTQLGGVSVRSSLLRAQADGETKATVEHEYRITAEVLEACRSLYALSYHEINEESINHLEWEIADATAYQIVRDKSPPR